MPGRPYNPRRNKYNVAPKEKRTSWDGLVFHSQMEMIRYEYLLEMLRLGIIDDLERQVRYGIVVNGIKVCTYSSDFEYTVDGRKVIEDVKGKRTETYKLKKKLVEAQHGIKIKEIGQKELEDLEHPRSSDLRKIYDRIQEERLKRGLEPYQPVVNPALMKKERL